MAEVSLDVLPADLIARADSLRDSREWEAAVEASGDVLAVAPLAWPFMAHRGHGLKEAGELEAAPAMYRQAEALVPDDFDVAMQIGDALRLLGRRAESGAACARAFRLDPTSAEAWREAEALDALPPGPGPVAPIPQLVLDITDLLAAIERLLSDPAARRMDPVPLRSWAEVAQELAGAIAAVAATGAASERGLPSSGPVWQFGRSAVSRPDIARADAALLLDLPAVPAGALSIVLDSAAGVGLSSLLLCRLDDVAARLSFLEGQRFRASPFVQ